MLENNNINSCTVVVMTCDKYEDCWEPFFKLKDKYWNNCPYDTYLITETKNSKYSKTIKTIGEWTKRLREALEQIDTDCVIIMLDDFFLHKQVNQARIEYVLSVFDDKTAVFNCEMNYDASSKECGLNGFKRRPKRAVYKNSCQPSIHNRLKLLERLQKDTDPWTWELTNVESPYDFYINDRELIFDIGYYIPNRKPWGIVQGKWARDCIDLFERENIKVDFNKRGFYD